MRFFELTLTNFNLRVSHAHDSLHDSPVLNAFNFRYYKASVFWATLVPLLAFLVIFYATLLIYYNVLPSKEIDCKKYIFFRNATIEMYDFTKNSPFKVNVKEGTGKNLTLFILK